MRSNPAHAIPGDQASRLRELANCNLNASDLKLETTGQCAPRVIMVGEIPNLQRGFSLTWYLANEFASRGDRCLIVDLSAAASLFPSALNAQDRASASIQPLWQISSHGRTLNHWLPSASAPVDVLAQPGGDCPTAEQMQRICEQLIRHLAQQGQQEKMPYSTVFFLSCAQGIPVDGPCWQVADDVLLLWSPRNSNPNQLSSAIESRLTRPHPGQRLTLMLMRTPTLRDWSRPRRSLRKLEPAVLDAMLDGRGQGLRGFDLAWPMVGTFAQRQRMHTTAARITSELGWLPIAGLTRQAS